MRDCNVWEYDGILGIDWEWGGKMYKWGSSVGLFTREKSLLFFFGDLGWDRGIFI